MDRDEIKVNNNAKKGEWGQPTLPNKVGRKWPENVFLQEQRGKSRLGKTASCWKIHEKPNPCLKIFATWHRNTTFLNHCFYFLPYSDCVNEMQDKECEKYELDCKVEERYAYHRHIWEYCSKTCNREYKKIQCRSTIRRDTCSEKNQNTRISSLIFCHIMLVLFDKLLQFSNGS